MSWGALGMADHQPQNSSLRGDWLITVLAAGLLVGGAFGWRWLQREPRGTAIIAGLAESADAGLGGMFLPRTRALVAQKTASLEAYNQAIPEGELLRFLTRHLDGRTVRPETLRVMTQLVTDRILPALWRESQQASADGRFITHRAMARTLHKHFPRQVLANADVILFPEDDQFRVVVAEPPQDHFRDSGWHWRWIGLFLDRVPASRAGKMKELDVYAAEELSEFLSVFAIGWLELAAREVPHGDDMDPQVVQSTLARMVDDARREDAQFATEASPAESSEEAPRFSAEVKKRVLDAVARPMFQDVTEQVQLDFVHRPDMGLWLRRSELQIPLGIAGGGVSASDFDGDGDADLYFAGDEGGRLFRNDGGRQFVDVTAAAGLRPEGESRAGYFVDFDNDGDADLYVTFVWESNRMYQNDGSGMYADVTHDVGLTDDQQVTHEAVWFDMDNDGLLDVYTANFGPWPAGAVPTIGRKNENAGPNRLYHHRMDGNRHRFVEVGGELRVDDHGWTHCVGAWDYDQDGHMDLFSLNDFGASLVYRNLGGNSFAEVSRQLHLDATYNAMNFTLLDLGHDGHPAIYITEIMKLTHRQRYRKPTENTQIVFSAENLENLRALVTNRLYLHRSDGTYQDEHNTRIEPAELGWAWDATSFDYDNDSDLDLLVLNGTESKVPTERQPSRRHVAGRVFVMQYANARNVMYCSENGYFYNVSDHCPIAYSGNSRGSALLDFDADGDLDIAVNNYFGPGRLFENVQQSGHHWVRLHLTGRSSNRDAVGARVAVYFEDRVRYDQVVSGSGFLSQNTNALHFGLGGVDRVDRVVITWPSGIVQELRGLQADTTHRIEEPSS